MTHPTPGELLELHFAEADSTHAARWAAHVDGCAACRARLGEVAWAESVLAGAAHEPPPEDGFARVLARIEAVRPTPRRPYPTLRAALPSAAVVLAGTGAVCFGGAPAALAFFAAGSLVTLSLAPTLILESQRRGREAAAR